MMTLSPNFQPQVPAPNAGFAPVPFEGGMPGIGPKGPSFGPGGSMMGGPAMFPGGGMGGMIQQLLQRIMAARGPVQPQQFGNGVFGQLLQKLSGRVAGGTGTRGPDPSPFAGLAGLAGPFGNGGGPIAPNFTNFGNKRYF